MIELKEGLELTGLKETEARMSFQRFFRLYKHFSGMTRTGKEASNEFWMIYGTPVLCIPNHRKNKRKIYRLKTYTTKEKKRKAIVAEVVRIHNLGRPVLIGTKDIDESETFGRMLSELGLHCRIINAVRSEDEANVDYCCDEHGGPRHGYQDSRRREKDWRAPRDCDRMQHVVANRPPAVWTFCTTGRSGQRKPLCEL